MSARYLIDLKTRKSKIIHVYRNGDKYSRAALILLRPVEQKELERILRAVEEKIILPNNKPIKRMFTIEGDEIEKSWQIEDQSYYVVGSTENFIKTHYGTTRYWTILGPVKWSKWRNVIYEPPEIKETETSRLTSAQWKLKITVNSKPSTKMTKSMSAFHNSKGSFRKEKKMALSVGQAERTVSEPPNDRNKEVVPLDDLSQEKNDSLELGNNLSDSTPIENDGQIENFLNDTIKMSAEFDMNKQKPLYMPDERMQTKYHYDIVSDITNLTSDNEKYIEKTSFSNSSDVENNKDDITTDNSTEEKRDGNENRNGKLDIHITDSVHLEILNETEKNDRNENSEKEANETFSCSTDNVLTSISEKDKDEFQKNNLKEMNNNGERSNERNIMFKEENEDLTDDEVSILKEEEIKSEIIFHNKEEEIKIKDNEIINTEIEEGENSDDSFNEKEKAALLIQANFRGHFKRKLLNKEAKNEINLEYTNNIKDTDIYFDEIIEHPKNKDKNNLQDINKKKEVEMEEMNEDDITSKEKAALIIQSNFRGCMVREEMNLLSENASNCEGRSDQTEEKIEYEYEEENKKENEEENENEIEEGNEDENEKENEDEMKEENEEIKNKYEIKYDVENKKESKDEIEEENENEMEEENEKSNNEYEVKNDVVNEKENEDEIEKESEDEIEEESEDEIEEKNKDENEEENDEEIQSYIKRDGREAALLQSNYRNQHSPKYETKNVNKESTEKDNHTKEMKYSSDEEMDSENIDYSQESNKDVKNDVSSNEKITSYIQPLLLENITKEGANDSSQNERYLERKSECTEEETYHNNECIEEEKMEDMINQSKTQSLSDKHLSEEIKEHLKDVDEYKFEVDNKVGTTVNNHITPEEINSSEYGCHSENVYNQNDAFQEEEEDEETDIEDDNTPQEKSSAYHQENLWDHMSREKINETRKNENHSYNLLSNLPKTEEQTWDETAEAKEKAAIIIQSNFRGYLTRIGLKSSSDIIENYESDGENNRSYAAQDSEEEDENIDYSPLKNNKFDVGIYDQNQFSSKYSEDSFIFSNKDQEN